LRTKIQKWGNSLGVRIPCSFAAEVSVESGSAVDMSVENGTLTIRPVLRRHSLSDLLDKVTPRNIHEEITWGEPEGQEIW
jgi:antitoxin MazE